MNPSTYFGKTHSETESLSCYKRVINNKDLATLFYIKAMQNWVGPEPYQIEQVYIDFTQ